MPIYCSISISALLCCAPSEGLDVIAEAQSHFFGLTARCDNYFIQGNDGKGRREADRASSVMSAMEYVFIERSGLHECDDTNDLNALHY